MKIKLRMTRIHSGFLNKNPLHNGINLNENCMQMCAASAKNTNVNQANALPYLSAVMARLSVQMELTN